MRSTNIRSRVRKARRRLNQQLGGHRLDLGGLPLPRVLVRCERTGRIDTVMVAGGKGHILHTSPYYVRLERAGHRSVIAYCHNDATRNDHDGMCPGNAYHGNVCYHCFEAVIMDNWEVGRRVAFCQCHSTAMFFNDQFLGGRGNVVELSSGQSGGSLFFVSWEMNAPPLPPGAEIFSRYAARLEV